MEFTNRKYWIDTAKGYAMFLVFYAHLIEKFISNGDNLALQSMRFLTSFTIPVFFILSGLLSKESRNLNFFEFVKIKFYTRIIPILFFNLLLFIPAVIVHSDTQSIKRITSELFMLIISGDTSLNVPTWFLVCFLSLETIHFLIGKYINNMGRMLFAFILFFAAGILISYKMDDLCIFGYRIFKFWGLGEAITAYSLYMIGMIIKRCDFMNKIRTNIGWFIIMCTSLTSTLLLYDLNKGPFKKNGAYYVDMASSNHGNTIMFLITAISGSIFIISLSKLIPKIKPLTYIGKNSLIFMGLNGFFLAFVNKKLINWLITSLKGDLAYLSPLTCIIAAVVELAICVPLVYILSKYFPELIGNIKAQGVISTRIIKAHKTADY